MSRVLQQDSREFNGGRIGKDRPAIARFHHHWQPSGVVQVRVREHQKVNRLRIDRQGLAVAVLQFLRALKNSAIHQQPLAHRFDQILRTRNASGRTKKCKLCHRRPFYRIHSRSAVEPWHVPEKTKRSEYFNRTRSALSFRKTTTNLQPRTIFSPPRWPVFS